MCGLVGLINKTGEAIPHDVLTQMRDTLRHRGPDGKGNYIDRNVGFGFRRLSILDLSKSGQQPMSTLDGKLTIVFNGEIYNFVELRSELRAKGYEFRSTGDTEVLLYAFREWGRECLSRLNGMWAFLIYDKERRTVFGSRDRFGIKPLYCHSNSQALIFASEIKAIRESSYYSGTVNWNTAAHFLINNELDYSNETLYTDIHQIPAGTAFFADCEGNMDSWRFWTLPEAEPEVYQNAPSLFAELFEDSVRLRLRSDVPVGVSLSGGLDSTSIICAMNRQKSTVSVLPTMAFSFNDPEFDESRFVRSTIRQTNAELVPVEFAPSLVCRDLKTLLRVHDEPVHSATAYVGYKIMECAKQHGVTVMLNGQGADETLGGYPSYFRNLWHSLWTTGHPKYLWSQLNAYTQPFGGSPLSLYYGTVLNSLKAGLSSYSPYRRLARMRNQNQSDTLGWFSHELRELADVADRGRWQLGLDEVLRKSVEERPLPLYLRIEDRNSMAHSVEARLPFLDYRLVELAFRLSPEWKLQGPWNKYILRTAMQHRIPENVRTRVDKFGFPVPIDRWFREPSLNERLNDLFSTQAMMESGIYDPVRIRADLQSHRSGRLNIGSALFDVFQFETWRQLISE